MRKVKVLLHNIRSIHNLGAILRTADGFGVKEVALSGITPLAGNSLPHIENKLMAQVAKTALGAEKTVPIVKLGKDLAGCKKWLEQQKTLGYDIFGLENNIEIKTSLLFNINSLARDKLVLVVGEEVDGISQGLYNLMDYFVEIPMFGEKESFNVSVATGIALYEILGRDS